VTRDEEQELINEAILFGRCLRDELPAIQASIAQIRATLIGIAQDIEQINMRQAS